MLKPRVLTITAIVAVLAASRLVPHPWNFTPVTAMALFGGCCFARTRWAFAIPLAALVLSDIVLESTRYGFTQAFWVLAPFGYGCFLLTVAMGWWVRRQTREGGQTDPAPQRLDAPGPKTGLRFVYVGGASLVASVLFFLVTNFAFWLLGLWMPEPLYPMSPVGLVTCYVAGLPFFGNALAGDLLYTLGVFGGFALLQHFVGALREEPAPQLAVS
jgi:hypothetical protein